MAVAGFVSASVSEVVVASMSAVDVIGISSSSNSRLDQEVSPGSWSTDHRGISPSPEERTNFRTGCLPQLALGRDSRHPSDP